LNQELFAPELNLYAKKLLPQKNKRKKTKMQDRLKYNNRVVFTFVFIGVVSLFVFTSLILIKNKSFVNRVYFKTVLNDANGLSSRPPIFFKGFEIGRIDTFELDPDTNLINVKFYIYEDYVSKIIKYTVIAKSESVLLGATNQFEILVPNLTENLGKIPLKEGEVVPFIDSQLGQFYANKGQISVKSDSIESILKSVDNLLINLQKNNNPEAGSIFSILDKLSRISDRVLKITEDVDEQKLVVELSNTIEHLQGVLHNSNQTISHANSALKNAESLFSSAENAVQSYGSPDKIIATVTQGKVPIVLEQASDNLQILQDVLTEAHMQKEQLGLAIIALRSTLEKMEKTLEATNNNPLLKGGIEKEDPPIELELNEGT
jgi:phospholipid/cholesterol/gamma-HCH transport system substrate-binding protein